MRSGLSIRGADSPRNCSQPPFVKTANLAGWYRPEADSAATVHAASMSPVVELRVFAGDDAKYQPYGGAANHGHRQMHQVCSPKQ